MSDPSALQPARQLLGVGEAVGEADEEPATSPAVSGSPPLVWLVERLMLPLLGLEHELRI